MGLIYNETEINDVIFNGISLDKIICNNIVIFEKEPFDPAILQDFEYTNNKNGTYTLTGWKGTYTGVTSTECIIPDNPKIIL